MPDLEQRVQAFLDVGVEVALAAIAFLLVSLFTIGLANSVLGSPLAAGVPVLTVGVVLVGTAVAVGQGWSSEHLGHFLTASLGAGAVWVLVVGSIVYAFDLPLAARDPVAILTAWSLGLATAYVAVYVGEDALA
ncbi:hypothetical protein G9C85_00870 [Halorubellus sp. JP-L1]|uniref:hypothetical protein n=1 Tax=Halorubellus sp. JP-L1 TaxID=2715753 RepID=UPI00140AB8CB|nr:hypothetical protein [Halorubellus sp. JP-L1]NHN40187.1 hypothetical protein [Halorubellus sp. JP-L1]